MKRNRVVSRNFETIMGVIGSIIGIFSGSYLILLADIGQFHASLLGIIAILAAVLGLFSSYYVRKDSEVAGFCFIIATLFVIIGSSHPSVLSAVFLLIAGISSLFRK